MPSRWSVARRASVVAATFLATLAVLLGPSAAGVDADVASAGVAQTPTPSPSPSPAEPKDPTAPAANPDVVTFGVQPASSGNPDQRPFFSYGATPGATVRDQVAVLNYSNEPLTLGLYATDALNTDDGGFALLEGDVEPTDAGTWLDLGGTRTVTVPPRSGDTIGRVILPIFVKIPVDADPGDHGAGIVAVLSTLSTNEEGANVRLDQRVGSRVFVRVSGDIKPELTIENLKASYDGSWNPLAAGKARVSYTVRNTGNVKLGGKQAVQISGLVGGARSASGLEDIPLLFPGSSVDVTTEISGVWPLILMDAEVTITPLRLQGDENGPMPDVTASTRFWAIPWALIAIVLALVLSYVGYRRWIRHRNDRRASGPAPDDDVARLEEMLR